MLIPLRATRTIRHVAVRALSTSPVRFRGPFKVLFCGSDEFSIGSLRAVLDAKDVWESIHVITPSERVIGRKSNRDGKVYKPALKAFAEDHNLPVSVIDYISDSKDPESKKKRPESTRSYRPIDNWNPPSPFDTHDSSHLLLTASFGHIIPNNLLGNFDPHLRLNVHPSLLPRWRGAAPIHWTIAHGDRTTGVSVQRLVEKGKGIDAGDLVGVVDGIDVPEDATFGSLLPGLAETGGTLLVDVLRRIIAGTDTAKPQDPALVTRAPKLGRETGHINWLEQSAVHLDRLHRAIGHQIPLWTELSGQSIQLIDPKFIDEASVPSALIDIARSRSLDHRPGTAWLDLSPEGKGRRVLIACIPHEEGSWDHLVEQGHSWLEIRHVRPETKREMSVRDWWNGLGKMERKRNWVQFKGRRFLNDGRV